MRIAAVIALAVAAMFVLYNIAPRGGDAVDENDPGRLTVDAVNAAAEQAETLGTLFESMSLLGGGETTSDAQEAYRLMKQYSEQGDLYSDKLVKAARDLREAWEPLYVQAHKEYKELNTRIEIAKSAFTDYFEQNSALAAAIDDPDFRRRMRESDLREQEIFDSWATQADNIAALAYDIMQDMQDVNVYIARTNLSAHFAAQNATGRMTASLKKLDIEIQRLQIGDFRASTDELNSILVGQSALTAN